MSKRERIAALEADVSDLKARILILEARPYQTWTMPANPPFVVPSKIISSDGVAWVSQ